MRVNISNNIITSIDFDTIDQIIDFIKKFNEQSHSTIRNIPFVYNPIPNNLTNNNPSSPWYTITCSNSENTLCSKPQ